jgi:hypothetical protein
MIPITQPVQHHAQHVTDAWAALPSWFPVPGLGALPINSFLLKGAEPLLVDTGLGALAERLVESLCVQIGVKQK